MVFLVLSIILIVVASIFTYGIFSSDSYSFSKFENLKDLFVSLIPIGISGVVIFSLLIKKFKQRIKKKEEDVERKRQECEHQMQELNSLFDYSHFLDLVDDCFPSVHFNKYTSEGFVSFFINKLTTASALSLFFSQRTSINSCLSGTIDGKPFLFFGYRNFYWGNKTYTGTLTVTYTEWVTNSEGKRVAVTRVETLIATLVKPYPMYREDHAATYLSYAAEHLSFSRKSLDLYNKSDKEIASFIKKQTKKIEKKEKNALKNGESWTALGDNEFESLFNANSRNNDVEFRMMFTPYCIKNYKEIFLKTDA